MLDLCVVKSTCDIKCIDINSIRDNSIEDFINNFTDALVNINH